MDEILKTLDTRYKTRNGPIKETTQQQKLEHGKHPIMSRASIHFQVTVLFYKTFCNCLLK